MNWDLIGWSFSVIRRNPRLAVFPALSAGTVLAVIFLFVLARYGAWGDAVENEAFGWADYLWGIAALFAVNCIVIFFNCALAVCAHAHFSGGQPTLRYGIEFAAGRLPQILGWALLSTSIGVLLDAIERRVSMAGKITVWLFGFAWAMATYLVVPVLVAEDRGAFESVRRAAELARGTWSKQIVAELRFGWRALLFFLPAAVLFALGMNGYPMALPAAVLCGALCAAAISAARGIFEVALYRYAALGETPRDWPSPVRRTMEAWRLDPPSPSGSTRS